MSDLYALESDAEKLRAEGKYQEAADLLMKILDSDPSFVRAHLGLAVTYHLLGDYAKSVEHGVKATEVEPTDPFNFTALSVTYRRAFAGTNDPQFIQLAEDAKYKADSMMHQSP